ncbi:hypothetical protein QVD99_004725 [Batrachochytrium dendrobatidis]|nr:hypothetical protein QVD99_004725 [Batrachochytrium dendrobatidis]
MMVILLLVQLALFCSVALCAGLKGRIATNVVMQDVADLPVGTKVVINHGEYTSYLTESGDFNFPAVRDGSHLLQVLCLQYNFPKIRLDVNGKIVRASITETGKGWEVHGKFVDIPLVLEPLGSFNFFRQREGFSIMSIFANPMLLMSGGTMLLFFLLPKIQASVDREAVEEYKNNPDAPKLPSMEMPNISKNLADFFSPSDSKSKEIAQETEDSQMPPSPKPTKSSASKSTPSKSSKKKNKD